MKRMCGSEIIAYVLIFALFLGGWSELMAKYRAADPAPRLYRIVAIFSADYYGPCKDLERWMRENKYPYVVKEQREQPAVDAFPSVCYEAPNHTIYWDNGQVIMNWQTERPETTSPVQIILWRTK